MIGLLPFPCHWIPTPLDDSKVERINGVSSLSTTPGHKQRKFFTHVGSSPLKRYESSCKGYFGIYDGEREKKRYKIKTISLIGKK